MKKPWTLLAVGALGAVAWGAGQSPTAAADPKQVVNLQCGVVFGNNQPIVGLDASPALKGTLALACPTNGAAATCAACEAALLAGGYQLDTAFNSLQSTSHYAGAYYVFSK